MRGGGGLISLPNFLSSLSLCPPSCVECRFVFFFFGCCRTSQTSFVKLFSSFGITFSFLVFAVRFPPVFVFLSISRSVCPSSSHSNSSSQFSIPSHPKFSCVLFYSSTYFLRPGPLPPTLLTYASRCLLSSLIRSYHTYIRTHARTLASFYHSMIH